MFYEAYLNDKHRRNFYAKKLEKNQKEHNAPVTIRDLVLRPVLRPKDTSFYYGESKTINTNYPGEDRLIRMQDHIELLFKMVNAYHEQAYCELTEDGTHQLKKAYQNTITRISTSEFFFYGKNPMTLDGFSALMDKVQVLAMQSHDNVHLLLSSFSVVDRGGKLLNVALYVQGGADAKIEVVCKGLASSIDIEYGAYSNYSQQQIGEQTNHITPFIAGQTQQQSIISNNSLFEVETKGGAKYTQGIDICLDHANKHSKRLLEWQLKLEDGGSSQFIPVQADHIVTSNSINLEDSAKLTPSVLHIDPRVSNNVLTNNDGGTKIVLQPEVLTKMKSEKYQALEFEPIEDGLIVKNPAYGGDYSVSVSDERTLGAYVPSLASMVEKVNQSIMSKRLDYMLESKGPSKVQEYHAIEQSGINAFENASLLMQQLTKQSKPCFFEYLFGTQSYYLKQEAQAIIAASSNLLTELNKSEDFLISATPWVKDLELRLQMIDGGIPHSYLQKMLKQVEVFKNNCIDPSEFQSPSL